VSSFGYSGTIAHVVLAEPPASHRRALGATADESRDAGDVVAQACSIKPSSDNLVWTFTGQGSMGINVGREYFDTDIVYRESLSKCDAIIERLIGIKATDLLYPDINNVFSTQEAMDMFTQTSYSQPMLVVLEYCLSESWKALGVWPQFVLGHSLGAYAAAIVAEILTLEDALRLVCARGSLMQSSEKCKGCMVSLRASESDLINAINSSGTSREVGLAAVNTSNSVVLSGSVQGVEKTLSGMMGVPNIRLGVKHAFHSPLTESVLGEYKSVLASIQFRKPGSTRFVSTVLGKEVTDEVTSADYWCDHITGTVRFKSAVEEVWGIGGRMFLEIGPDQTLTKLSKTVLDKFCGKSKSENEFVSSITPKKK
jgi:acyl transferase domain-containing protein